MFNMVIENTLSVCVSCVDWSLLCVAEEARETFGFVQVLLSSWAAAGCDGEEGWGRNYCHFTKQQVWVCLSLLL